MPIHDRLSLRPGIRGEGVVWLSVWNALVTNRAVSCVAETAIGVPPLYGDELVATARRGSICTMATHIVW